MTKDLTLPEVLRASVSAAYGSHLVTVRTTILSAAADAIDALKDSLEEAEWEIIALEAELAEWEEEWEDAVSATDVKVRFEDD